MRFDYEAISKDKPYCCADRTARKWRCYARRTLSDDGLAYALGAGAWAWAWAHGHGHGRMGRGAWA